MTRWTIRQSVIHGPDAKVRVMRQERNRGHTDGLRKRIANEPKAREQQNDPQNEFYAQGSLRAENRLITRLLDSWDNNTLLEKTLLTWIAGTLPSLSRGAT